MLQVGVIQLVQMVFFIFWDQMQNERESFFQEGLKPNPSLQQNATWIEKSRQTETNINSRNFLSCRKVPDSQSPLIRPCEILNSDVS